MRYAIRCEVDVVLIQELCLLLMQISSGEQKMETEKAKVGVIGKCLGYYNVLKRVYLGGISYNLQKDEEKLMQVCSCSVYAH